MEEGKIIDMTRQKREIMTRIGGRGERAAVVCGGAASTEDGLNCLGGPGGDSDNNQQTQWSDTAASCNIKGRVRRATSAISASQARIPSHWMALVQVHRGPL